MSVNSTVVSDSLTGIAVASQEFATLVLGPEVVGWMVEILLLGVVISQFMNYLSSPSAATEATRIKLFAWVVVSLAALQAIHDAWTMYHYSTSQYRDVATISARTFVDCFATFFIGIEGALVQTFLATRAARLFESQRSRVAYYAVIFAGVFVGLFGSMSYVGSALVQYHVGESYVPPYSYNVIIGCWLWGSAFVDVTITLTLIFLLKKRIAGFSTGTDGVLRSIINLAIETASYTASAALLGAILTDGISETSDWSNAAVAFWIPLSAYYALSLLTTLNARASLRTKATASYVIKGTLATGVRSEGHVVNLPINVSTVRTRHDEGGEEYEMGAKGTSLSWQKDLPSQNDKSDYGYSGTV